MKKAAVAVVKASMFDKTYFELLELPHSYEIDLELLEQHSRQLLQRMHPDRYVNSTPYEQRLAVQYTSLIHQASETLKSPVKRAAYLLKLQHIDVELETNTGLPNSFLIQQMEWREKKLTLAADSTELEDLQCEIQQQSIRIQRELIELFQENTQESLSKARDLVRQLTFIEKLLWH